MLRKKIFTAFLVLAFVISGILAVPAMADSASVSAPSQAFIGDEIEVILTFECTTGSNKIGAIDGTLQFDSAILSCTSNPSGTNADGNGKYILLYYNAESNSSKHSMKFKFKCNKAGTAGIYVSADITDTELTQTTNKLYNTSIKIIDKSTLSGNAKLKKLTLSAGSLSPAFEPNVTSYNVNIDYSVTQVLVSATTEEAAAKIDVQGSSQMKVGQNTRTVVVTAPNGTVKKYTLNIYRASSGEAVAPPVSDEPQVNPYEITVDGQLKYMVGDYSAIAAPNGFSPALYKINETDIPVLQDVVSDRIIVYATNKDDTAGMFYLYDKESKAFSEFRYLAVDGFNYIVLDYTENAPSLDGYRYAKVKVENYTVNGFKYKDARMTDFVIFYAENALGGKEFYRYDSKEKTVQRATEFALLLGSSVGTATENTGTIISKFMELELKDKLIAISAVLIIVLIIVLVIIIIVKATRKVPSQESLEAAKEQQFMDGFGEVTHLYLDDDYEGANSDETQIDTDFVIKEDEQQ